MQSDCRGADRSIDLPEIRFKTDAAHSLSTRRTPKSLAKNTNDVMINLQNERLQGMSDGRLQMPDKLRPVLSQVVLNVIIVGPPTEHVRAHPSLREPKVFRINLQNLSFVQAFGFEDKRVVFLHDAVCFH